MKLAILLALLGGSGVAAVHAWMRKRGRDPLGPEPSGELADTSIALGVAFVVWLLAQLFVPVFPPEAELGAVNGRTMTVLVVTCTHLVIALVTIPAVLAATLRPSVSIARRLSAGVLAAAAVLAVQLVYGLILEFAYRKLGLKLPMQDIVEESRAAEGADLWVRVVCAIALAPFAEELFFRGVLFPAAARALGPARGLLVQAAAFWLIHCVADWKLIAPTMPLAALGWISGWLYLRTGSLAPSILLHASFNAFNFAMLRMADPPAGT